MPTKIISQGLLMYLTMGTGLAQAAGPDLNSLVRESWQTSPTLQSQKVQTDLTEGDRYRRFIFNEPQFQFTSLDDHSSVSYGVTLGTAFPGKTFALAKLDTAKAHAAVNEFDAKRYELTKVLVQNYLDCASAQAAAKLQEQTSADLQNLFKTLKAIYENGKSSQAEKIGAELQARQSRVDLTTASDKAVVLCKKLDAVLEKIGLGHDLFVAPELPLPDDLDKQLVEDLGIRTADQARSAANIEVADAAASTAVWSQFPDLVLGLNRNNYIYQPASPSGKVWTTSLSLALTVPILFPFHETVEAKRAKSQAAMDRNAGELLRVTADSDQIDGAKEYQRSIARLKDIRDNDLPLAQALVESTYSSYQTGRLGYAEIVLSRRTLTDLQNQDIQLRVAIVNAHLKCLNHCQE